MPKQTTLTQRTNDYKTLRNKKRQARKVVNKKQLNQNRIKDMTKLGEEYEMKKTNKKNKALNENLAHKGILKKSTRIDEENQKNSATGIIE